LATLSLNMKIAFASFLFAGCLLPAVAAPVFKLEGDQLVLPSPIIFKGDTAELDETASRSALDHIRQYLAAKAYISKLRIEAHTDSGGDAAASQQLTDQRALAVACWLKAQGTDCQRRGGLGRLAGSAGCPTRDADESGNRRQQRRGGVARSAGGIQETPPHRKRKAVVEAPSKIRGQAPPERCLDGSNPRPRRGRPADVGPVVQQPQDALADSGNPNPNQLSHEQG
jgi:hypothetical protein